MKKSSIFIALLCVLAVGLYIAPSPPGEVAPTKEGKFLALCETGTLQEIQKAIQSGADVNARDNDYWSPLMRAAKKSSNPEVIAALVKAGADIHAKDGMFGASPLMHAAMDNPRPEIITALLNAGADINGRDNFNATPLIWAARVSRNPQIIDTLLAAGALPKAKDNDDTLAVHYAQANPKLANTETFKKLQELSKIDDPYADMSDRQFLALCKTGNLEAIQKAIQAGANVNARDLKGDTPLIMAATYASDPKIIEVLIKAGADINARGSYGTTPLQAAALDNGQLEITQALLKAGADINTRNNYGHKPLLNAVHSSRSNLKIIETLLKADIAANGRDALDPQVLVFAAKDNTNPEVITLLVKAGMDVNYRDRYQPLFIQRTDLRMPGITPLMWAAKGNSNPAVITALLKAGAEINALDERGNSPLKYALRGENFKIIMTLIKAGADVNAKDGDSSTPLMFAISDCKPDSKDAPVAAEKIKIASALIKAGADVNATDENGKTALMYAAKEGLTEAIMLLLDAKAYPNIEDKNGRIAAEYIQHISYNDESNNPAYQRLRELSGKTEGGD